VFLGFSVWLLWRNGRLRDELGPFRLGAASAVFAIVSTWIALLGIVPQMVALLSYAGVAGVVAASVWSFVLSRRPGSCVDEMVREAQLREQRAPLGLQLAGGALALATLYAMYWSINVAGVG
jgi:hypothetical protein